MFDVVQIGDIINLWILHPWKILLELDASFDAETHKHETTNSDGDPDNTERIDEPVFRIWKRAKKTTRLWLKPDLTIQSRHSSLTCLKTKFSLLNKNVDFGIEQNIFVIYNLF